MSKLILNAVHHRLVSFLCFVFFYNYNKIGNFGNSAENSALNNRARENRYLRLFN